MGWCVLSIQHKYWKNLLFLIIAFVIQYPSAAQDGLDLPAELYILLNEGRIERYGIGAAGVQAITTDTTFILDFAIAPDNNWLAYRTEEGLYLSPLSDDNAESQLLDTEANFPVIRGKGNTISWSPDGQALAYTTESGARVAINTGSVPNFTNIELEAFQQLIWSPQSTFLAAEASQEVWWIFRRDGAQMNLVSVIPGSKGISWLSDNWLIFAPPEGGLRLMDLSAANIQTVLQDESRFYYLPAVLENGEIVVFSRDVSDSQTDDDIAYLQRLAIEGGQVFETERSELPVNLEGLRWVPKGGFLIGLRSGQLSLVLPQSGQSIDLPIESIVAYTWGAERPPETVGINSNHDLYFLSPDLNNIVQLWRLPGNGIAPQVVTNAANSITDYFLPDSASGNLHYISDGQLWQQSLVGDELQSILTLPEEAEDVSISRTENTIAFATVNPDTQTSGGIWFASPSADIDPQLVLPNSGTTTVYSNPIFSPQNDNLLVNLTVNDSISTVMLADGEVVMLGNFGTPRWTDDGRVIAFGGQTPGELLLVNPETRPITPLLLMRTGGVIRDFAQLSGRPITCNYCSRQPIGAIRNISAGSTNWCRRTQ